MARQARFDAGEAPDFLPETKAIRDGDWKVAKVPADLLDRRVEITGPVDRKMIVNALNSGAKVFMGDFEDATSPGFGNMIEGQINLKDRWADKIDFKDAISGKSIRCQEQSGRAPGAPARLASARTPCHRSTASRYRARWSISASMSSTARRRTLAKGTAPYFYLPKIESHLEARLWDEVFSHAERELGVPPGTFKATILIETLPAAFELDEILYEMREHIVGLNCGRWDYIFSFIKRIGKQARFLTPDRAAMTMGQGFPRAYSLLVIKTCHRRGAFAMGGMAAQIPVKNDAAANEAAFAKVRADKEREAERA